MDPIVDKLITEAKSWEGYEKFDPFNDVALGEFLGYKSIQTNAGLRGLLQLQPLTAEEQNKLIQEESDHNTSTGSLVYLLRSIHGGRVTTLDTPYENDATRRRIDETFKKNGWTPEKASHDSYLTLLLAEHFATQCASAAREYGLFIGKIAEKVLDLATEPTIKLSEAEAEQLLKGTNTLNITTAGLIRLIRDAMHHNKPLKHTTPYDTDRYRDAADSLVQHVRKK